MARATADELRTCVQALCDIVLAYEGARVHWGPILQRALDDDDLSRERIRGWFGGMGALDDLVFRSEAGHNLSAKQEAEVNAEFVRRLDAVGHAMARVVLEARGARDS